MKDLNQFELIRCRSIEEVIKNSDVIFLPYLDKIFNKISRLTLNKPIVDIWNQIYGPNIFRNFKSIKAQSKKITISNIIKFKRK